MYQAPPKGGAGARRPKSPNEKGPNRDLAFLPPDGNGYRRPRQGLPWRRMPLDRTAVRRFLKGNKKTKKWTLGKE